MMASDHYTIFCYVIGLEGTAFSAKLPSSATIDDLKDEIKKKKEPRLDNIPADELTLWRASPPFRADDLDDGTTQLSWLSEDDPAIAYHPPRNPPRSQFLRDDKNLRTSADNLLKARKKFRQQSLEPPSALISDFFVGDDLRTSKVVHALVELPQVPFATNLGLGPATKLEELFLPSDFGGDGKRRSHFDQVNQYATLSDDSHDSKRLKGPFPSLKQMQPLYELFWGKIPSSCFKKESRKVPNLHTLTVEEGSEEIECEVVTLPEGCLFPCNTQCIVVLPVYETFRTLMQEDDMAWNSLYFSKRTRAGIIPIEHTSVITGQPGIGKTVFLSYLLIRRLQDKMPTMYCSTVDEIFMFDEDGVVSVDPGAVPRNFEIQGCCALVNLGVDLKEPPRAFAPLGRKGRVIVASSPNKKHMEMYKENAALRRYMPTWSWDQIYFVYALMWAESETNPTPGQSVVSSSDPSPGAFAGDTSASRMTDETMKQRPVSRDEPVPDKDMASQNLPQHVDNPLWRLRNGYSVVGGIPRRCQQFLIEASTVEEELRIEEAITRLDDPVKFRAATRSGSLFSDDFSHRIIRVEPVDDKFRKTKEVLLTTPVATLVYSHMNKIDREFTSTHIRSLLTSQRVSAAPLFEAAVHRYLGSGTTLVTNPLTVGTQPLYIALTATGGDKQLLFYNMNIRTSKGARTTTEELFNKYLIPVSKTQESIDSVWMSRNTTVFFQITVSCSHPIKLHGLEELTQGWPADRISDMHIVFVLPADDEDTKDFKEQKLELPVGDTKKLSKTRQAKLDKLMGLKQHVYRFDYRSV